MRKDKKKKKVKEEPLDLGTIQKTQSFQVEPSEKKVSTLAVCVWCVRLT